MRRTILLTGLALALSACGGGGGGPAGPAPGVPQISNMTAAFSGLCSTGANRLVVDFDFQDSDGNVGGGTITLRIVFVPSGLSSSIQYRSGATGTFGRREVVACVTFGSSTSIDIQLSLVDSAGNASNSLLASVARPGAATGGTPGAGSGGTSDR